MIVDFDDDTHFCLKCHSTIIGLDTYVSHRKSGCTNKTVIVDLPKSPLPSQLLPPDDSFNLKADDFFSSLELQSSTKRPAPSSSSAVPTSTKSLSGVLTRSKTTAAIQATTSTQKDEIPQSKSGKNAWIGGHQLKLGYGDNQSKLIKAVDNLERRKEEGGLPNLGVYEESDVESEEFDFDVEEFSEDDSNDAPPRNHTGGKWKPSSPRSSPTPPIQWVDPPPSFTGGKWKPKRVSQSPPPTHTKGKWKPSFMPSENFEQVSGFPGKTKDDQDINAQNVKEEKKKFLLNPPPSYTKGKWIPAQKSSSKITDDSPFRKSSGTVQYWCRPCNRRLASKVIYERHLQSDLHFKRTYHDNEFDDHLDNSLKKRKEPSKEIAQKDCEEMLEAEVDHHHRDPERKRKRKKIFEKCRVCNSKVSSRLIGKHLISHYHCRKGDLSSDVSREMVLGHIWAIVLQSPYQCGICRFYFNHHKDFLEHWLSKEHFEIQKSRIGYFWCSMCKFRDDDNGVMYSHLTSQEHLEVISVINRSVPIVIRKISTKKCEYCGEEFGLNIALKKHWEKSEHCNRNPGFSSESISCRECHQDFRSQVSLKRHQRNFHEKSIFGCTSCNLNLDSKEDVKVHRNSSQHRHKVQSISKPSGKKCQLCSLEFVHFGEFKDHLQTIHPEYNTKCLKCGMTFTLPQELSVHSRCGSCKIPVTGQTSTGNSCDKCAFSSFSTSELLFHKVLHCEPIFVYPPQKDGSPAAKKGVAEYKCPLCDKFFVKASLLGHLRVHTQERPFVCGICGKGFVRKNNLALHVRNHSKIKTPKKKKKRSLMDESLDPLMYERPFLCSTCGASFRRRSILTQHMTTHMGKKCKCPELGCFFLARNNSALKQHLVTHSNLKNFPCDHCDYNGKTQQHLRKHLTMHSGDRKYTCSSCSFSARTSSHLKRHQRLHTGAKPYKCPHCIYKCSSLENLRKHVLSTQKHPGSHIYTCKFCPGAPFVSNFAKDFNNHLLDQHGCMFKTNPQAASFIARIYDPEVDNSEDVQVILQQPDAKVSGNDEDEIFPGLVLSADEEVSETAVDDLHHTLNIVVGSYDVEESGALVPFNDAEEDVLFQDGHF